MRISQGIPTAERIPLYQLGNVRSYIFLGTPQNPDNFKGPTDN